MAAISAHHPFIRPGGGVAAFVGGLLVVTMAMLGWGLLHRAAGYAVVLVSIDDCRRAFDDAGCRAIVERAQAVQASTAPSFERLDTCELIYGSGGCAMLKQTVIQLNRYAPSIAAIALTSDQATIVPLYFGKTSEADGDPALVGRPGLFPRRAGGASYAAQDRRRRRALHRRSRRQAHDRGCDPRAGGAEVAPRRVSGYILARRGRGG